MDELEKSRYNQITLKASKSIVSRIRKIAKTEERTIQTVTNRLLMKAITDYDSCDISTDDFVQSVLE